MVGLGDKELSLLLLRHRSSTMGSKSFVFQQHDVLEWKKDSITAHLWRLWNHSASVPQSYQFSSVVSHVDRTSHDLARQDSCPSPILVCYRLQHPSIGDAIQRHLCRTTFSPSNLFQQQGLSDE